MNAYKFFQETYSAVTAIYTIGKTVVSFLSNRYKEKKIDDAVKKVLNDNVEQILEENLHDILQKKQEEINRGNYEEVLDEECKANIVNEIISKNRDLEIYRSDIEAYVQDFVDNVLKYLKSDVDERKLLDTIISIYHSIEHNADKRRDEIKEELNRAIYAAINEYKKENDNESTSDNKEANDNQLSELPFEVGNLTYNAEVIDGNIVYVFAFDVSKKNFKVVLEDIFVASESKTELWTFHNISYFWSYGRTTQQRIKFYSKTGGIRKINLSGIVAFCKIYNSQDYYIRIFGDMNNLYYEQLSKDKYEVSKKGYKSRYRIAEERNSGYDEWSKYHASVMYTDFGC